MKNVSVLIKPVSGACDLRCRYCFYHELETHGGVPGGRMSLQTLENLVRGAFEAAESAVCFAFQGGEPMLAGLDFFRAFVRLEERYRRPGVFVERTIQTNGTHITPEWARFFREHGFLVGISVDGTRALHDAHRVDATGAGSFDAVRRGLAELQKAGVETNALCVVTSALARHGQQAYEGLKKLGFSYLQFIPCLDALGAPRGEMPYSLTPARYALFLRTVFDRYYRDWAAGCYVSVRQFDDYVHLLAGQRAGACAATGQCGQYFVVEADGSCYPCDFYVLPETRTGNVNETPLAQIAQSAAQRAFEDAGAARPAACGACEFAVPCGAGGCRRDHVPAPDGTENYFCPAYRAFFAEAMPRLKEMAAAERRMRERKEAIP